MANGIQRGHVIDVTEVTEVVTADVAAERAVLGAVMLDEGGERSVWRRVSAILSAGDFYDPKHIVFWKAFDAMHTRGIPLDVKTVTAELDAMGSRHTVGAPQSIGDLTDDVVTVAHCEVHARLVLAASQRRRLRAIGVQLARSATDPTRDPARLRDAAVDVLRAVHFGALSVSSGDDIAAAVWGHIDSLVSGTLPPTVPFGVPSLDRISGGGMRCGGTYFMVSRPGIGKTTAACQIAVATARRGGCVLYVALEPKALDIGQTMASHVARVSLLKITRAAGELSGDDMSALATATRAIAGWKVHVVDEAATSCPDTVAKIESAMRSLPEMPALVVVDHLLKLRPTVRRDKAHEGTGEVVASLVSLGKRTGATVLCLGHIGRNVSNGSLYRRPRVEDIAGGDSIARDADGVLVLHREDKYPTKKDSVDNPLIAGITDVFIPKFRGVEDNTFTRLMFRGAEQRFDAIEPRGDMTGQHDDEFPPPYGDAE